MPAQLNVVARFKAKSGKETLVRSALEKMIEPTRAESGNVGYALHQGTQDPASFVLYEGWTSEEALKSHMQQPYFEQMDRDLDGALEKPYEVQQLHLIGGLVPA